jgi:hypothetical protein
MTVRCRPLKRPASLLPQHAFGSIAAAIRDVEHARDLTAKLLAWRRSLPVLGK